jgi:ubiquinone biosynthesis UbiH/UbiF/VisC/COQ6 family hydroxylase
MTVQSDFDVLVVGGGLVGAACALALQDSGLTIALVEAAAPPAAPQGDDWDSRIYAISPGNAVFLARLGAWDGLDHARVTTIEAMRVQGDAAGAVLEFSAYDAAVPALGYLLESRLLQTALWQRLQQAAQVALYSGIRCQRLDWHDDHVQLTVQDGRTLTARLVIGADGGQSWTRAQAGLDISSSDYRQLGVVANFATEKSHHGVAYQWFRDHGALAWLPLPDKRMSMVWSTPVAHAQELLALSPEALAERVALAGGRALGELRLITAAAAFPLRLQNAECMIAPRLALAGDAAHLVHPLAGQGVNLGFHDAACLAEVLTARGAQGDAGAYGLLRRYERARKADIMAMQAVTDGLHALFASELPGVAGLRNWGMRFTNRQQWLKRRLMAHAMI